MQIRAVVWGENVHEQTSKEVQAVYPDGMHETIAAALAEDEAIDASTATLQQPEHGLTEQRLESTDVLLWWGTPRMARLRTRWLNGCSGGCGRAWA